MSKILFNNLKKGDANKLRKWWDANTKYYHFVRKQDNSKYYQLIQQDNEQKETINLQG